MRLGVHVIAVDSYAGAPAMQVAQQFEVINMLDAKAIDNIIEKHKPQLIIPEIEAIRTEQFYTYEQQGYTVIPSAKAANFTMNRKAIRDLAAKDLGLKTAEYTYATTLAQLQEGVRKIGLPCVVKPLMSSSGKGQSTIKTSEDIEKAWNYAQAGQRGDANEVIVEAFVPFLSEITLLTVSQQNGPTLFCAPIGHRQQNGDYRESWQPAQVNPQLLTKAQHMAQQVTAALDGAGIWGVEFFLTETDVYFSELSPRPHDTGMVTLANTQNLNQFELHARAILGLPIPHITQLCNGASAAVLAAENLQNPQITGIEKVLQTAHSDVRIFGKPTARPGRRMAVVLLSSASTSPTQLAQEAAKLASQIQVIE